MVGTIFGKILPKSWEITSGHTFLHIFVILRYLHEFLSDSKVRKELSLIEEMRWGFCETFPFLIQGQVFKNLSIKIYKYVSFLWYMNDSGGFISYLCTLGCFILIMFHHTIEPW